MIRWMALTSFVVFAAVITSEAQATKTDPSDLQTWTSVGAGIDYKRWDASLDYQLRMEGNSQVYKGSYLSPEVGYRLLKGLRGFANFRIAFTSFGSSERWGMGMEYVHKFGKWSVTIRPQMQYTQQYVDDGDTGNPDKWMLRLKGTLKYPLTDNLSAYASLEPFYRVTDNWAKDNIRNSMGIRWNFAHGQKLDAFFMYRPDYVKKYVRTFYVIGMQWSYTWKVDDKKKQTTSGK
ncbi:MAG: DUF2490 domain-containing protein [Cyclobacteriaceae bacterium]